MPPIGAKLSAEQIDTLSRWVDQGADWPASASTSRHWAWQPIGHPKAPQVRRADLAGE